MSAARQARVGPFFQRRSQSRQWARTFERPTYARLFGTRNNSTAAILESNAFPSGNYVTIRRRQSARNNSRLQPDPEPTAFRRWSGFSRLHQQRRPICRASEDRVVSRNATSRTSKCIAPSVKSLGRRFSMMKGVEPALKIAAVASLA
jgi:hypothetical protein